MDTLMHHLYRLSALLCLAVLLGRAAHADGVRDNDPATVRPVPRPGIEVSDDDRQQLEAGLTQLNSLIVQLKGKKDPLAVELLPDVLVYRRLHEDNRSRKMSGSSKNEYLELVKNHLHRKRQSGEG